MQLSELLSVSAIFAATAAVLGWWLRSRLESSIKHEYDKLLEAFRAEQKRTDVLLSERSEAFKALSKRILALRRYCHAQAADYGGESEFAPRADSLQADENMSLLQHADAVRRAFDEYELFVSPTTRSSFRHLLNALSLGFNLEVWMQQESPDPGLDPCGIYVTIADVSDGVLGSLYDDLGLPDIEAAANNSFKPNPLRGPA